MASVGISIPPQEHVTSPVAASKSTFNGGDGRRFEAFARRNSGHGGQSERAAAGQRLMRKRSWSMHGDWRGLKRRRKGIVPPTKFLLGGNICDPLNLGSLNDEEANRIANANTPVSSPMPTPKYRKEPIEVIIPPDISDPLGLNGPESLLSPAAQRRRKGKRRKKQLSGHNSEPAARSLSESSAPCSVSEGDIAAAAAAVAVAAPPAELVFAAVDTARPCSLSVCTEPPAPAAACPPATATTPAPRPGRAHCRRPSDEIVSPAVPQPGGRVPFPRAAAPPQPPVFRGRDAAFQYGNYNRYYGCRNPGQLDSRMGWLKREWFSGLDVLDVGCNVGHITLTVARDYQPRRCVGVDIDSSLIKAARRNVKHYQRAGEFPTSMPQLFGDLQPPHKAPGTQFPRNVTFQHANFVLESDALLETVRPEFDTILCLSITKWVHLNFGDAGIRRFFRRAFLSLRPGGRLLLEPQPWPSYVKKKKLTPRIWENFHQIRLRPENFPDLLINEMGFERYQAVGRPHHSARGFSRQLQLFTKAKEPTAAAATETTSQSPAATVAMETAPVPPSAEASPTSETAAQYPTPGTALPVETGTASPAGETRATAGAAAQAWSADSAAMGAASECRFGDAVSETLQCPPRAVAAAGDTETVVPSPAPATDTVMHCPAAAAVAADTGRTGGPRGRRDAPGPT